MISNSSLGQATNRRNSLRGERAGTPNRTCLTISFSLLKNYYRELSGSTSSQRRGLSATCMTPPQCNWRPVENQPIVVRFQIELFVRQKDETCLLSPGQTLLGSWADAQGRATRGGRIVVPVDDSQTSPGSEHPACLSKQDQRPVVMQDVEKQGQIYRAVGKARSPVNHVTHLGPDVEESLTAAPFGHVSYHLRVDVQSMEDAADSVRTGMVKVP